MRKRILIVDDAETVLMWQETMLCTLGFDIISAGDGQEAVDKAESDEPDLILMDVMMPRLNGIEACRKLRSNPKTEQIPIVMVTTKGEPEMVERAFMAGCSDYITKPIDKLELLAKVKAYVD